MTSSVSDLGLAASPGGALGEGAGVADSGGEGAAGASGVTGLLDSTAGVAVSVNFCLRLLCAVPVLHRYITRHLSTPCALAQAGVMRLLHRYIPAI